MAVVHAARAVLVCCSQTLPAISEVLVDCLLMLANDERPQISCVAVSAMQSVSASIFERSDGHTTFRLLLARHVENFGKACLRGEADVVACARLLSSVMYFAGPHAAHTECLVLSSHLLRAFRVAPHASAVEQRGSCMDSPLPRHHSRLVTLTSREARVLRRCASLALAVHRRIIM